MRKARLRFIHEQERTQMKSLSTRRYFKEQTNKRKKKTNKNFQNFSVIYKYQLFIIKAQKVSRKSVQQSSIAITEKEKYKNKK